MTSPDSGSSSVAAEPMELAEAELAVRVVLAASVAQARSLAPGASQMVGKRLSAQSPGAATRSKMADPLQVVQLEWRRRVVAEYDSAAITHSLLGWLLRLGASPTLLHEATRIIDDELVHAEMAFAVLSAARGGSVTLGGELGLSLEPGLSLLGNVCAQGTRVFCLGETVAVRLFKGLRAGTTVDVARQALDRVLVDEVRHRDFGWLLLEWLAQLPAWPELRALIEQRLPAWFDELRRSYGSSQAPFDDALRAWGLMPHAEYALALTETLERDYVPRFAEYGIDARAAGEARLSP